jgi:hypothetical protein
MEEDGLISISQAVCDHAKQKHYTQKRFDAINGFALSETRCINCHKMLELEIKKLK